MAMFVFSVRGVDSLGVDPAAVSAHSPLTPLNVGGGEAGIVPEPNN